MNKTIAVFLPPDSLGMSVMLIKNLLWIAAQYAQNQNPENEPSRVLCFSLDGKPVNEFSGGQLSVDCGLEDLVQRENPDAIFLSACWSPAESLLLNSESLIRALPQWHSQNIPMVAVSNATYFFSEAGLLDGKVATVYPPAAEDFSNRYPLVELRSDRAITATDNLYCANGIASGCDLIVAIIEVLFGPEVARRMNQEFLLGFQRNYQVANLVFDGQKYHDDPQVLTAQHWLERNYQEDISVEALAADRGMSPRNFSRRFKQATGDSPSHYLQRVRLEMAKELLKTTDLQISSVAYDVGYNDGNYFSRVFKSHEGCLPHQFRLQSKN